MLIQFQVSFIGELADDGGGPRRELWRMFAVAVKSYFEGDRDALIPRHDVIALQVVVLLVMSLVKYHAVIHYYFV